MNAGLYIEDTLRLNLKAPVWNRSVVQRLDSNLCRFLEEEKNSDFISFLVQNMAVFYKTIKFQRTKNMGSAQAFSCSMYVELYSVLLHCTVLTVYCKNAN